MNINSQNNQFSEVSTSKLNKTRSVAFKSNSSATVDSFAQSNSMFLIKKAELIKRKADKLRDKDPIKAVALYTAAIETRPNYVDAYYSLAKTHKQSGNYDKAISNFEKIIEIQPDNIEAITLVGECYKETGKLDKALQYCNQVLEKEPKYDYASRIKAEVNNLILAKTNPEKAKQEKSDQAKNNLNSSIDLLGQFYGNEYLKSINDVKFSFNETDLMSGHANIAQYEDDIRTIVVTDKYIWSAPEIVAAYLVHEALHAKDNDAKTSIKEEQEAYRKSIEFWLKFNKGQKDPQLDYAAELYNDSPEKLDKKVEEIYSSRDSRIPKYSPNHGHDKAPSATPIDINTKKGPLGIVKSFVSRIERFVKRLFSPYSRNQVASAKIDREFVIRDYK